MGFTGATSWKRRYEELLNVTKLTTYHEENYDCQRAQYDYDEVNERIRRLIDVSPIYDQMKIVAAMRYCSRNL